jgi:Leucine-rich repeat (LRR) protein
MNNYITTNIMLLSNFKLFQFNNYFWKLSLILNFNYIKSKNFKSDYKIFTHINKIIKNYNLNYKISEIINIEKLEICPHLCVPVLRSGRCLVVENDLVDSIPLPFLNLINLIYLDISCQKLIFIPKEFEKLINLTELRLYNNKIKIIPKQIGNLIKLQILNISNNKIKIIPKQIGNLINLNKLDIGYNLINILPKQIGNLINLNKFIINDNKIKNIPHQLENLVNLKCFHK